MITSGRLSLLYFHQKTSLLCVTNSGKFYQYQHRRKSTSFQSLQSWKCTSSSFSRILPSSFANRLRNTIAGQGLASQPVKVQEVKKRDFCRPILLKPSEKLCHQNLSNQAPTFYIQRCQPLTLALFNLSLPLWSHISLLNFILLNFIMPASPILLLFESFCWGDAVAAEGSE